MGGGGETHTTWKDCAEPDLQRQAVSTAQPQPHPFPGRGRSQELRHTSGREPALGRGKAFLFPATYRGSESESEVTQSCLILCDPMDCSLLGSSIRGIFQARMLEWVAISSSPPKDRTWVSRISGRCFTFWARREACGSDVSIKLVYRSFACRVDRTIRFRGWKICPVSLILSNLLNKGNSGLVQGNKSKTSDLPWALPAPSWPTRGSPHTGCLC